MAAVTSSAVAIPSFTGLRAAKVSGAQKVMASPSQRVSSGVVKASLKGVGAAVVATAASALIASNAMALEVLLGGDDGSLAFVPNNFSASSGEKIVFKNNAGFPPQRGVRRGRDSQRSRCFHSKISMAEEDLLSGPGETFSVTLTENGIYSFYCSPLQGAGMVGKVAVN